MSTVKITVLVKVHVCELTIAEKVGNAMVAESPTRTEYAEEKVPDTLIVDGTQMTITVKLNGNFVAHMLVVGSAHQLNERV